LTTATEELEGGKRVFRCRLKATWSLRARIAFWSVCGLEILLISTLASEHPWIWMLLLSMSLVGWWLEQEKRTLLLWILALLDEIATELGLVKIPRHTESSATLAAEQSKISVTNTASEKVAG